MTYTFVELGEGYSGEYDPDDPDDAELLRLDYTVDDEEVESLCTALPVKITDEQRAAALQLVTDFAAAHPALSPRTVTELFSYLEPSWLDDGIPQPVRALFGVG